MRYVILIVIISLFSCQRDPAGKKLNAPIIETIAKAYKVYHPNGLIKESGMVNGKNRVGWWSYFDKYGHLLKKGEFILRQNISYLNQEIYYSPNGKVDLTRSSYFDISVPDTISIGKSIGKLKYYTNPQKNYKTRFVYIIVDNETNEGKARKDTFTDNIENLWFGIETYKKGSFRLRGKIEEEISYLEYSKDSSTLKINTTNKYFDKMIWVK